MKRKRWFSALLTVVIVLGAAGLALMPAQARDRPPDEPPVPYSLTLAPPRAEGPVPGTHRVVATVLDRDRNPLENVEVSFVVTGAHRVTGRAVTDWRGQAPFSYLGTRVGEDRIVAFAADLTARTSKVWVAAAPPAPAVPTEITVTHQGEAVNVVCTHHWVTFSVVGSDKKRLGGAQVTFRVTGANPTSGVVTTNDLGEAAFSYHGQQAGSDTITVTAGEVERTLAAKRWVAPRPPQPGEPPPGTPVPKGIFVVYGKAENVVCTHHWMIVTVLGRDEKPLRGVQVTFRVTGANPTSGVVTTNDYGRAAFSYHGGKAGFDTITVTAGEVQLTHATRWVRAG